MTLESGYGVPAVPVVVQGFEDLVRATALAGGMPGERFVFVPMPVMGKTPSELRAYVEGEDPVTGWPVMAEVVESLTKPLTDEEKNTEDVVRQNPKFIGPDAEKNLARLFRKNHWTDMLPIELPTKERVAEMLKGTSHSPDEVIGAMRPTGTREAWSYTVEQVAVNAVMAGAEPEYFPVILALASTGITARHSSTSSFANMVVVNGPICKEIEMNSGVGAMGPYNHANATIGRAYGLLSQNLQGGSVPGDTYVGSQGNNYAYNSITFAENEDGSPWEPFHVEKGFRRGESVVSVFERVWATSFHLGLMEKHWKEHLCSLLQGINPFAGVVFVLDPLAANLFIRRGGFDTKEKLYTWVNENIKQPAGVYWDDQLVQNYVRPMALNKVEPYATWLKAGEEEMIPRFPASSIHAIVVGGSTNAYWRIMGCKYATSVSADRWR
jgi:hypothetical protein